MSDTITPINQNPTPCDFGPFAGRSCATPIDLTIPQNLSNITISPIIIDITERELANIDLNTYVVSNLPILWGNTIIGEISAGTAELVGTILTFTPDSTININRNVNIKYQVKDVSGIIRIGNLTVALTDITPALTTTNFTKSVLDSATLTGNITSNITIKNDTFKSLTFETPSEGNIVVNGASYTFTPGTGIKMDRVILVKYTVTTSSGLVSTSTITINVTYDNLWLKTFWYGNFLLHEEINQEAIAKIFQSRRQTNYKGTVTFIEELGKYKYIAYPKSWGITPKIVDSNMFPVAGMEEPVGYVTVEGIELVLFKTYNKINGPLTITIS